VATVVVAVAPVAVAQADLEARADPEASVAVLAVGSVVSVAVRT
jgi:hypothetical protein